MMKKYVLYFYPFLSALFLAITLWSSALFNPTFLAQELTQNGKAIVELVVSIAIALFVFVLYLRNKTNSPLFKANDENKILLLIGSSLLGISFYGSGLWPVTALGQFFFFIPSVLVYCLSYFFISMLLPLIFKKNKKA